MITKMTGASKKEMKTLDHSVGIKKPSRDVRMTVESQLEKDSTSHTKYMISI